MNCGWDILDGKEDVRWDITYANGKVDGWYTGGSVGTHLQLFGAYQDGKGTGSRMEMERWMVDGSDGRS